MIQVSKANTSPATLLSAQVTSALQQLDNTLQNGDTIKREDFDSTLYGASDVRQQIRIDQNQKCAYCERWLMGEDGGEIEHYRPKTAYRQDTTPHATRRPGYYWLAYTWQNLLGSCHSCNKRKLTTFPLSDPAVRDIEHKNIAAEIPLLIHPGLEDPALYLEYRTYWVFPTLDAVGNENPRGRTTIDVLQLNRPDLLELRRREWVKFRQEMQRDNLDFDALLQRRVTELQQVGLQANDMEFLGMFLHQNSNYA